MVRRHPVKQVTAYIPYAEAYTDATVTLGTDETLADHFTADEVAQAELVYIEPHAADAWVKFTGNTPATDDGHRIPQNEIREIAGNLIANLHITGSGAATITLLQYSGV